MPLESSDPLTLKRFYQNRQHVEVEEKHSIEEVSLEYRLGMMDPARDAARIERLNCIKKNVGKKKIMHEIYEKMAPRWFTINKLKWLQSLFRSGEARSWVQRERSPQMSSAAARQSVSSLEGSGASHALSSFPIWWMPTKRQTTKARANGFKSFMWVTTGPRKISINVLRRSTGCGSRFRTTGSGDWRNGMTWKCFLSS